jgi:CDP-glucose 4,6-dehydratase
MTSSFWRGKRVLITGHTGFKGAWLAQWVKALGGEVSAFALPPEANALWPRLDPRAVDRGAFIDLRDAEAVRTYVRETSPEIVLHLAAQAIVRRSYEDPADTFASNVSGTVNLLDALGDLDSLRALLVITSDKVYRGLPTRDGFAESDPLGGLDPYSASKAACELVAAAYRDAVFEPRNVAVATARAGNIIGGGDMGRDRILPDIIRARDTTGTLHLRAPEALRPWQHVLDALYGYLLYAELLATEPRRAPPALNFGPGEESRRCVREVVETACTAGDVNLKIEAASAMAAEPKPLWLKSTLAHETLGWTPQLEFERAIGWTVDWWRDLRNGERADSICARQIEAYCEMAQ